MKRLGFTLFELLVVISIMGVLVTLGLYGYNRLVMKTNIEADTKQILAMANRARQYSFTRKEVLKLELVGNNVRVLNKNGSVYEDLLVITKTEFQQPSGGQITFRDGFTTSGMLRSKLSGYAAEYDCVLFESSRIKAGRLDGANCNVR
jgi:prepilin-type N-terminal cleavage/methylation domain-containing protein